MMKSNPSIKIEGGKISYIYDQLRPIAEMINSPSPAKCVSLGIYLFLISYLGGSVAYAATIAAILGAIARTPPLNQKDMQRLHARALQNPMYEALWKKLEDRSSTSLEFVPMTKFLRPGRSKNDVSPAHYDGGSKKIEIYQGMSERNAFEALIFESVNAIQNDRFEEVIKKYLLGELSREEFAIGKEYIEWHTLRLYHQIMDLGKARFGWSESKFTPEITSSFIKAWEQTNKRFPLDKKNAHADQYRDQWDQLSCLYYLRHPENAPTQENWMNEIPDSEETPLEGLAMMPEIAIDWETDPFFQLVDKGAAFNERVITCICAAATQLDNRSKPEIIAIHVARIRKLLERGVSIPEGLWDDEKGWLKTHVGI